MSPAAEARPAARDDPGRSQLLDSVRHTVRGLLEANQSYGDAPPELRRGLAHAMVDVSMRAADLLAEERRLDRAIAARGGAPRVDATRAPRPAALAVAQSAGDQLGMQATRAAAGTVRDLREALDFPGFVTSLISGVFEAITRSNLHQLEAIGDLLDNVSTSSDDFTQSNVRDADAIAWALQKFPFLIAGPEGLAVRDGQDLNDQTAALTAALGPDASGVDGGDLAGTLLPLIKKKIGQSRQAILGTMVQMGLQRVVVDQGQLHASMEMRVDTSSVSAENRAQQNDYRVNAGASASFGVGMWGASASVNTSVGKIESDQQYTQEQIATRAGLRSSVDLAFRTEQIPLDRMADQNARVKLNLAARVPEDVGSGSLLSQPPPFAALPAVPATPAATPAAPPAPHPAAGASPAAGGATHPAGTTPAAGGTPAAGAQPAAGGTPRPATTTRPAAGTTPPASGAQPAAGAQPRPAATTPPAAGTQPAATPQPAANPQPAASPQPAAGTQPAAGGGASAGGVGSAVGGAVGSAIGLPAGVGGAAGGLIGNLIGQNTGGS